MHLDFGSLLMGFELSYQHELYRIEIFDEIELKDKQKLFSISVGIIQNFNGKNIAVLLDVCSAFNFPSSYSATLMFYHPTVFETDESKTSSGLKDSDIIHKILEAGHAFLSFIPSTWNSNQKILATTIFQQIYGTVNSSIELLLTVYPKQSVTQLE